MDDRAWQVQETLTQRGQQRSAGAVDLVVAGHGRTAGSTFASLAAGRMEVGDAVPGFPRGRGSQPTLLHRDRDFECIAAVTGQALQWYGPDAAPLTPS